MPKDVYKRTPRKGQDNRTDVVFVEGSRRLGRNPGDVRKGAILEGFTYQGEKKPGIPEDFVFTLPDKDFSNFDSSEEAFKWKRKLREMREVIGTWIRELNYAIQANLVDPQDPEIIEKTSVKNRESQEVQKAQQKVNKWLEAHGWRQGQTHQTEDLTGKVPVRRRENITSSIDQPKDKITQKPTKIENGGQQSLLESVILPETFEVILERGNYTDFDSIEEAVACRTELAKQDLRFQAWFRTVKELLEARRFTLDEQRYIQDLKIFMNQQHHRLREVFSGIKKYLQRMSREEEALKKSRANE